MYQRFGDTLDPDGNTILGLGKYSDGNKSHIKVTKRDPGEGLGNQDSKVSEVVVSEEWWQNSFNAGLAKISKHKKKKMKKSSAEETALHEPTLEDLFKATGGKRMGMRARSEQVGKLQRTEHNATTPSEQVGKLQRTEHNATTPSS